MIQSENFQSRPITRDVRMKTEKEHISKMSLEEKRKLYKCETNFVTLANVETWSEYHPRLESRLKQNDDERIQKYGVNESMNDKVSLWVGDITRLEVDAIVNAANNSLLGGGGVDGAIHRAAGPSLKIECSTLSGCETGGAKITFGYQLPANYVIHTVGPVGEIKTKLRSCYERCLKLTKENNLKSVAFPCISTGIYGYPNENAARVALETVREWLENESNFENVDRIVFCLFLPIDVDIYETLLQQYFPVCNTGVENS
ncbi:MACROD2 (predicted) [Pycnogonum litorale]